MSDIRNYSQAPAQNVLPRTSTMAIVSLILGITTWCILPIIGAIIAIITGHIARGEIRRSEGQLTGDGLALAGLILGYLQIFIVVIPVCVIVILALLGPSIGNVFSNIMLDI